MKKSWRQVLLLATLLCLLSPLALSAQNQQATKSLTLNVVSQLSITTSSLSAAVIGQPYSAQMAAAGGTTPYTWAVATGQGQTGLPPGLTMSTGGLISGTVAANACTGSNPCPFTFTVQVTDSSGQLGEIKVDGEIQNAKLILKKPQEHKGL